MQKDRIGTTTDSAESAVEPIPQWRRFHVPVDPDQGSCFNIARNPTPEPESTHPYLGRSDGLSAIRKWYKCVTGVHIADNAAIASSAASETSRNLCHGNP